ncbi:MAG: response regulator [Bdellovibrionia bacterium]
MKQASSQSSSTLKRSKIVIIDDEALLAETLGCWLENDHDVSVFSDSVAAFSALKTMDRCDVIFCDLMMPKMNGMEIYKQLSKEGKGLEKRMVFMTGGAFIPSTIEFLEKVPNHQLEKPFTMQAVNSVIQVILSEQARSR